MGWFRLQVIATIIWAVLLAAAYSQPALDVTLSAKLDRIHAKVGERVRMEITVQWSGSAADYNVESTGAPALIGLKIISSQSGVRTNPGEKTLTSRLIVYELEPLEEGTAKIGAIELNITDNNSGNTSTLSTEPMELKISPAPAPLVNLPEDWRRYALGGGLIVVAFISAGAAISMFRKKKEGSGTKKRSSQMETTPEEAFHQAMAEASNLRFSGDVQNYVTRMESALLGWFEAKFELPPQKWPEELIGEMKNIECLPADRIANLEEFARRCRAVKFAGVKPSGEELDRMKETLFQIVSSGTDPPGSAS